MRRIIICFLTVFLFSAIIVSCSTVRVKDRPEFHDVAPEFRDLNNQYIKMANSKGIYFTRHVTIGFKDIPKSDTMARCIYGKNFREIEVDRKYWKSMSSTQKMIVIWHESSHCYCGRDHDYAEDKEYDVDENPENNSAAYYSDKCPVSLMYPMAITDKCMESHYKNYINEMFDRCEIW